MFIWKRLVPVWEVLAALPRWILFNWRLARELRDLARAEQRPEEEMTAELLAEAIRQRKRRSLHWRRWRRLSRREQQVAALVCLDFTNEEIAAHLTLSPETIKTHISHILAKFDLHSKSELRDALSDWDFSFWLETENP